MDIHTKGIHPQAIYAEQMLPQSKQGVRIQPQRINPQLLAKLYALQAIFAKRWKQVPLYSYTPPKPMPTKPIPAVKLKDVVKEEEEKGGSDEGGGGTLKGLRGDREIPRLTRP